MIPNVSASERRAKIMLSKEYLLKTILGSYEELTLLLKNFSKEEIVEAVCEIIGIDKAELENLQIRGYTRAKSRAVYEYVIKDLIKNISNYDWLYHRLNDRESKEILMNQVRYRLIPDEQFLQDAGRISREFPVKLNQENENIILLKEKGGESVGTAILNEKEKIQKKPSNYAICVHDVISDLWVVPRLIDVIKEGYRFYLRHYEGGNAGKTLLYVLPGKKERKIPEKIHRVVAMAPYERPWSNVELVKDCGLIPYLLYKNHGCDVSMVGAKGGEYPYEKYIRGMKLEFLEDGKEETKINYIVENGSKIDCLILRGCHATNFGIAAAYKTVNPEGKIYVGLDANSHWMDRILWYEEDFTEFMNCCDIIATSCTAMQKHLNEKWPWDIKCIPNGYYNLFSGEETQIDYHKKENIILTVGRLGTIQKATEILLEAFAVIADRIPDWNLRLVGNVEEGFLDNIRSCYEENPKLQNRVVFTGNIENREELNKEYERAKIFALPSRLEGGTPNVIAEALHAGCALAVTRFDAYEDAVGKEGTEELCGRSAPIDHVDKYAEVLLKLCTEDDLQEFFENAVKRSKGFYDMEKIVGGLYEQLCI